MRKGTLNRYHGRIGLAVAALLLATIAAASVTSGLHITAGDLIVSMDLTSEKGLHIRFGKALGA